MGLALKSYAREQVAAQSQLATFFADVPVGKSLYKLDFDVCNRNFVEVPRATIKIALKGEGIWLSVPLFLVNEVMESVWCNFLSLRSDLKVAVLEKGLKEPLDMLEEVLPGVSVEAIGSPPAENSHSVDFFLTQGRNRYKCLLHTKKSGLDLICSLSRKQDSRSYIPPVYTTVAALAGRVWVSSEELRRLRSGDLIFFSPMKDPRQVLLTAGNLYWTGMIEEGGKIMVLEANLKPKQVEKEQMGNVENLDESPTEGAPISPPPPAGLEDNGPEISRDPPKLDKRLPEEASRKEMGMKNAAHSIDKISLELTFELGRSLVMLQDLKNMKKGHLFNFPHMKEPKVNICVNSQRIGDGELVKIDGSLAVRVVNLEE